MADEKPWLKPHFVGPDGNLNMRVQSLVVDTGAMKIVVDTCTGNDKVRKTESWHMLKTDFLERFEASGYKAEDITHVFCTHLHVWVDCWALFFTAGLLIDVRTDSDSFDHHLS